jgi:DNA mismatch endonuclease (patch repair protein)
MSRVKSRDTAIEVALRKALWHEGIRYRKNYKLLPGKPDIAITKYRIAIFCDGEFWHGRDWARKQQGIRSNRDYWLAKIEKNIDRDTQADMKLYRRGWLVFHFWGDDIKKDLSACVWEVREAIMRTQIEAES